MHTQLANKSINAFEREALFYCLAKQTHLKVLSNLYLHGEMIHKHETHRNWTLRYIWIITVTIHNDRLNTTLGVGWCWG